MNRHFLVGAIGAAFLGILLLVMGAMALVSPAAANGISHRSLSQASAETVLRTRFDIAVLEVPNNAVLDSDSSEIRVW